MQSEASDLDEQIVDNEEPTAEAEGDPPGNNEPSSPGAPGSPADVDEPRALAHAEYLDDVMAFTPLAVESETTATAVVGYDQALFWHGTEYEHDGEALIMGGGIPLPLGHLLPIHDRIDNPDGEWHSFFEFEGNLNYLYVTEYQDQTGLVFGSDLAGLRNNNEANGILSLYYSQDGRFSEFFPFSGMRVLTDAQQERLTVDRAALQRVRPSEYRLNQRRPDDMVSLYVGDTGDRLRSVFITTDLISHGMHLFFSSFLQEIEETYFVPRLNRLVEDYLEQLRDLDAAPETAAVEPDHPYRRTLERAHNYLLVAQALLNLAPVPEVTESIWGPDEITYVEPDREAVLSGLPHDVRAEIDLIDAAAGMAESPVFGYTEDYSQFQPRGHYTKNGILEAYFRAMMWFGRLHAYVSTGEIETLPQHPNGAVSTALQSSLELSPTAYLLAEITRNNPDIFDLWQSLFEPVTALIGMSDDLSFHDVIPFWEEADVTDFRAWVAREENVLEQINRAHRELEPPRIAGNSVFFAPAGEELSPPMGWRLFGQRFTWDSFVHHEVSAPRLYGRMHVTGLDIMRAFGSRAADRELEQQYELYPELMPVLDRLEAFFADSDPEFWEDSYYNRVLAMIRDQAQFESGRGLYFTETPAWDLKALLSSHGTWAALRHDTILYVKQSAAEMAGGDDDFEAMFRTLPPPEPIHYIEPNVPFFQNALGAVEDLQRIAHMYDLMPEGFDEKIQGWINLLSRVEQIAAEQWDDQPITPEDNRYIRTIPSVLARLVVPPEVGYASYFDDPDNLKMALVADVFTNAELAEVVEVGLGIPYRILVALNDGQGGKRIATGYVYSYYEFPMPVSERMTNEQWRPLVYQEDPVLEERLPPWSRNGILEPR